MALDLGPGAKGFRFRHPLDPKPVPEHQSGNPYVGFGFRVYLLGGPPPCNSGIIGIQKDANIILSIPYIHYYRVEGVPLT